MITAVGAGEQLVTGASLADLYVTEYRPLVRLASLLVDDVATAEEVVQDAFVRAAARRLDDPVKAAPYLRSCVLNGARSVLRRRRVAARLRFDRSQDEGAADSRALANDRHDRVLAALRTLPPRQRECVVLRFYAELSEQETAEAMGVSAGSVKTHCHRALAALAPLLEGER